MTQAWMLRALAVAALIGATAFGSVTYSSTGGAAAVSSKSSTINIMQVTLTKEDYFTLTGIPGDSQSGVEAAFDEINRSGGIYGHKIKYIACVDTSQSGSATQAAQCGQKAVADHVVAFVGNSEPGEAGLYPVIHSAGIPVLSVSNDEVDETDPLSFYGVANAAVDYASVGLMLAKEGCKHTAVVSIAPAASYASLTSDPLIAGLRSGGSAVVGTVDVPIAQIDFTATAAQIDELRPAPDCLGVALIPTQIPGLLQAIKNSGHRLKVGNAGPLSTSVLTASTGALYNGTYVASTSIPYSSDVTGWTNTTGQNAFIAALNKYFPGTAPDAYSTDGAYWAQAQTVIKAAETAGANGKAITAKSIDNALSHMCNFNPGTAAIVDFCHAGTISSLPRLFGFSSYIEQVKNQKLAIVSQTPISVAKALKGFTS